MTLSPNPNRRRHHRRAFTLLELLVVLAILAVIATGVAGVYGRKNIDEAKDKMTLHEMREIKKAFLQFENDNFRRLRENFADHAGTDLPTSDFESQFDTPHLVDADAAELAADEKL
ncbi:MAG: prepilin-type N-terminal cleavage/methylation domain-containing protein, partial [Verrucomicrobiae bacterium]|nr:prepilin-type N-terminal cleavage/methylation domain-containing protein [Verrucomicrobiae bacterium]